jgi:hypothetical protein
MPPAAPEPTTTASYVLVRSAGDSAIEEGLLVATRHRLARVLQGYTASQNHLFQRRLIGHGIEQWTAVFVQYNVATSYAESSAVDGTREKVGSR